VSCLYHLFFICILLYDSKLSCCK